MAREKERKAITGRHLTLEWAYYATLGEDEGSREPAGECNDMTPVEAAIIRAESNM